MRATSGRRRPARPVASELGSVSLFLVVGVFGLFAAIGLVVDGGGKVHSLQHADDLAAESARAGGQAISPGAAVLGDGVTIDPDPARAAATAYLQQAGVSSGDSTVAIVDGTTLRVTVTTHYQPIFLGMVGLGGQIDTTGSAEASLVTGVDPAVAR